MDLARIFVSPPLFIHQFKTTTLRQKKKKEGEIKTSRATIATGAIIRLLLTQGGRGVRCRSIDGYVIVTPFYLQVFVSLLEDRCAGGGRAVDT